MSFTESQVSCVTTVSMESETERDPEERLGDFREEEEERCVYRSVRRNSKSGKRRNTVVRSEQIHIATVGQEWE